MGPRYPCPVRRSYLKEPDEAFRSTHHEDPMDEAMLEDLVDAFGLAEVLEILAGICEQKAAHDEEEARAWRKDGRTVRKAATRLIN